MSAIEIQTCGPVTGNFRPPGSKSITNRALLCAALADGTSRLDGVLFSEDTEVMARGLQALGIPIELDQEGKQIRIEGIPRGIPADSANLNLQDSGTSMRFLTAACCLGAGTYVLDGSTRMRERPIRPLVSALNQLGAEVACAGDCPPVTVQAHGLKGGSCSVDCSQSSQFLSAVLMALPFTSDYTVVHAGKSPVSLPYVNMTCQVMRQFGVDVCQMPDIGEYSVDPRHRYQSADYPVEPDATAASYYWAMAAITGGRVKVLGLTPDSIQGDIRFVRLLEEMGCAVTLDDDGIAVEGPATKGLAAEMGDISDTVQTLAAVALFVEGETTIRGIAHNRFKETDRIGNLARELRKLGAEVEELADGMTIRPGATRAARVETWNDHRMAMALSLAGLRQPGVVINNPRCVSKTWPSFFEDLQRATGQPVVPAAANRNGQPG